MFKGKKVLVVGMARSGVAAAEYLIKNGATVTVSDSKSREELEDIITGLENFGKVNYILGKNPGEEDIADIDFAVVSPGVPLDLDYIVSLKKKGKEVISEIELAYRASREKKIDFIGITGTNGKTTTTSIVGEIFKAAGIETYVVGNIGSPATDALETAGEKSVFVTELSSFQLESIVDFRPVISGVLNLTGDHMNRHHTMENYAKAKAMIFKNQGEGDFCVLNMDDEITKAMAEGNNAKVVYFSRKSEPERGVFINEKNEIVIKHLGKKSVFMKAGDLSLPGGHNQENCMAAIAMAFSYGIEPNIIKNVLKTFKAVEHRLEYVDTVNGVMYVNDSKGTNPDSTIKAVQSYEDPIILIAGGYDKGSDFNELFEIAKKHVKSVIVLGQTAELVADTAVKHGINDIHRVKDIREAVELSGRIANPKDVVLLSPACASWGMYNNYEERGADFKNCVKNLNK